MLEHWWRSAPEGKTHPHFDFGESTYMSSKEKAKGKPVEILMKDYIMGSNGHKIRVSKYAVSN